MTIENDTVIKGNDTMIKGNDTMIKGNDTMIKGNETMINMRNTTKNFLPLGENSPFSSGSRLWGSRFNILLWLMIVFFSMQSFIY
jgi:hypothetical protein